MKIVMKFCGRNIETIADYTSLSVRSFQCNNFNKFYNGNTYTYADLLKKIVCTAKNIE